MPAFFSSPEFAETIVDTPTDGTQSVRPTVRKFRMEVFHDDEFYELYLVDREYSWGKVPHDVQITSHGVYTSFIDALSAIDDFIESYRRQKFDERIESLRGAFDMLVSDPAAKAIDVPSDIFSRGLMRYAAG